MGTSVISVSRLKKKWHVTTKDLTNMTTTPVPDESYDDEYTANIAGIILAKILKSSFIPVRSDKPEKEKILK